MISTVLIVAATALFGLWFRREWKDAKQEERLRRSKGEW